ncbi:MAG: asparagine synthase-related protein [Nitrososphaerales archaeon]
MQSSNLDLISDPKDFNGVASIIAELDKVARDSVRKFSTSGLVISYSGGVDSSILAELAYQTGSATSSTLLSVGSLGSRDIRELSVETDLTKRFPHVIKEVERDRIQRAAFKVQGIVQVPSLSHFEDCVAFYLIAEETSKLGKADLIASANGPDELFCGYDRFRRILHSEGYESVIREIANALEIAKQLQRQVKIVLGEFGLKPAEPFLSAGFARFALQVPVRLKIFKGNDRLRKRIWRDYGRTLGLPENVVMKEKKAMQYSMGIHGVVLSMVRKNKIRL